MHYLLTSLLLLLLQMHCLCVSAQSRLSLHRIHSTSPKDSRTIALIEQLFVIPQFSDTDHSLMLDTRGKLAASAHLTSSQKASTLYLMPNDYELNFGSIFRKTLDTHYVLGSYLYYDIMKQQQNMVFRQLTFGMDVSSYCSTSRLNVYLPFSSEHPRRTKETRILPSKDTVVIETVEHTPLKGLEFEIDHSFFSLPLAPKLTIGSFYFYETSQNPDQHTQNAVILGTRVRMQHTRTLTPWAQFAINLAAENTIKGPKTLSISAVLSMNTPKINQTLSPRLTAPVYRDIDIRTHKRPIASQTLSNVPLPEPSSDHSYIPAYLFQTHYDKTRIPERVLQAVRAQSLGYDYFLYDDNDIRYFLAFHYPQYLPLFEELQGAHKADLARYLLLYTYGGVYFDIKTIPLLPLDTIFDRSSPLLYTVTSSGWSDPNFVANYGSKWKSVFQGILATPRHNAYFMDAVRNAESLVASKKTWNTQTGAAYDWFIENFFHILLSVTGKDDVNLGRNHSPKADYTDFYLFQETCLTDNDLQESEGLCAKTDWRGSCCIIKDQHKPIFLGRDPEYPW